MEVGNFVEFFFLFVGVEELKGHDENPPTILCKTREGNLNHSLRRSPHVRESKTILDSGFHAVDSRFQILLNSCYGFHFGLSYGFFASGVRIPESNSYWDSGFLAPCGKKSPGFRNPDFLTLHERREQAIISALSANKLSGRAFLSYRSFKLVLLARVCMYHPLKQLIIVTSII